MGMGHKVNLSSKTQNSFTINNNRPLLQWHLLQRPSLTSLSKTAALSILHPFTLLYFPSFFCRHCSRFFLCTICIPPLGYKLQRAGQCVTSASTLWPIEYSASTCQHLAFTELHRGLAVLVHPHHNPINRVFCIPILQVRKIVLKKFRNLLQVILVSGKNMRKG